MRERGSNTARPTEKGGGGSPDSLDSVAIRSRFGRDSVAIGRNRSPDSVAIRSQSVAIRSVDFGASVAIGLPIRSQSVAIGLPIRSQSVAIRSQSVAIGRNRSQLARVDAHADVEDKTQKSPLPQSGNRACSCCYVSCVSMLRLIPQPNKRASARIVLQGLARQWCIVMPMSDRRHIARYI